MDTTPSSVTLRGLVSPLPSGHACRVALVDGDAEYHILPRGAGIDLADMVSRQLEVAGTIIEEEDAKLLHVRSYTVLDAIDDDSWYADKD
jgi:hypothetical protein